jgi:hypothetical protein
MHMYHRVCYNVHPLPFVLLCYIIDGSCGIVVVMVWIGGVRVKRSVKMSQALPGAGQSLMPRTGIGEVGFTETKSPDKDKDDKGKKGIEGTRMAQKKKNQNGEAKRVTHAPAPTTSDANEQDGGDGEGRVVASLQRQVEALQADLQTRSEHCNKLQEQLRRREDEWLRVSRQVR